MLGVFLNHFTLFLETSSLPEPRVIDVARLAWRQGLSLNPGSSMRLGWLAPGPGVLLRTGVVGVLAAIPGF